MKVCIDGREYVPGRMTGIRRYLTNLLRPLTGRADLELAVCARYPDEVRRDLPVNTPRVIPLPAGNTQWVDQAILPRAARALGADFFFSPYYKLPLAGRFRRVMTVHDILFLRRPGLPPLRKWMVRLQLRVAIGRANLVLADSDFTRADVIRAAPGARRKMRTLYPSLDEAWYAPVAEPERRMAAERWAGGRKYFLYVGNFKPHKNVELLVAAFQEGARRGWLPEHDLLLVGGDAGRAPRMRELIGGGAGAARIRLLEDFPDEPLRALYAAADWLVTASAYEGFGYPVVEAMAVGCPVVCPMLTSLGEVTGGAALPIPELNAPAVADVLRRAAAMPPADRQRLIAGGRDRARSFAPQPTAEAFLAHLRTVLPAG